MCFEFKSRFLNLYNDILTNILDLKINLKIFIKFLNGPHQLPQ